MKSIVRRIGKFGFLLSIMGFFMPVACDMNAFQIIEYVDAPAPALIIGLFILALVGLIIGALLLMKKNIPIFVDWLIILTSIGIGIGLLSINELDLQYGAYVIIAGFCIEFIFLLIALHMDSSTLNESKTNESKKVGEVDGWCKAEYLKVSQLSGNAYSVITPTKIFYERDINSMVVRNLGVGDQVSFRYEVKDGQILWYFVTAY